MRNIYTAGLCGLAMILGMAGLASPASAQDFYEGKTITVIVGLEPGGTADTFARRFSTYLQKYIPGEPNIVIQNMPGGAGVLATNYVYEKASPDGLTILWGPWDPLAQALGHASLRARYENFEVLGGTGDTRVNYAKTTLIPEGLKVPADIVKADLVITGDSGVSAFSGLFSRLALDVLGVNNKLITGYKGGTDVFLALQRDEVQFHNTSITTFRSRTADYVASGGAIGINYFVPVDADGNYTHSEYITDIPAFPDLYKEIYGEMPSGPSWDALNWLTTQLGDMTFVGMAPPNTPPEAVEALREAYQAASSDPEFVAETMKMYKIPYTFVGVESCEAIFKSLSEVSPEVIATLQALIDNH